MNNLPKYRDWRPTGADPAGLCADRYDIGDWLVLPVLQTRDSGPLAQSNFATAEETLTAAGCVQGNDYQIHRFGHWGPGWFEIILANPNSPAAGIGQDIASALEDYPVLSEEDWSRRELEAAEEAWSNDSIKYRLESIRTHNAKKDGSDWFCCRYCGSHREPVSPFAARRDEMPAEMMEHYKPEE